MKKTFAEEIAELTMPARKEIDPDDDFLEQPVLVESDEELLKAQHKSKGVEIPRLRGSIGLEDDPEYIGKKSSREGFFGELPKRRGSGIMPEEGSPSASLYGSAEDTSNDVVYRSHESDKESYYSEEDEIEQLEKEYEAVEEAEAEAANELKDRAEKERRKAIAVKAQTRIWNSGLEARILLQKVLQGANRLPRSDSHAYVRMADEQLATDLGLLAKDAYGALEDIFAVLDALDESRGENSDGSSRKRKSLVDLDAEKAWEMLDERYSSFAQYRDSSVDRWHRKTLLAAGGPSKSSLKVLNQSVSKQVSLMMKDKDQIIERTQLPMSQFNGLCETFKTKGLSSVCEPGHESMQSAQIEERAEETYHDAEFYQALLNEFLEGKTDIVTKKLHKGPKNRKIVDRRASKGRKIRYHIHEKIVNFMTPTDQDIPDYTTRIFSNLFA